MRKQSAAEQRLASLRARNAAYQRAWRAKQVEAGVGEVRGINAPRELHQAIRVKAAQIVASAAQIEPQPGAGDA